MNKIVDLFCGAGGLSYGFNLAGFETVAALDFDPVSGATYRQQHPTTPFFDSPIESITGKMLRSVAGSVDVVIGGPSCQGFSTHGKRDANDPRNQLFKQFVRIIRELQPSWIVMENVKGLLTYDGGRYRDEIHESFHESGYAIESRVLNAADYGVPQFRQRVFFIATNTQIPIRFPTPTHCALELVNVLGLKPFVTVRDAIGDLPLIGDEGEAFDYASSPLTEFQRRARFRAPRKLTLHRARRVSELAMSVIRRVPQGAGIRSIPVDELPSRFHKMRKIGDGSYRRDCTTLYYRLGWDKPSYTITCYFTNVSSGPFVHPTADRALTAREAARLQSFPDSYRFTDKQIQRQIGNAVPPLLAEAVAKSVLTSIRKSLKLNDSNLSIDQNARQALA
jgi:DNA (cytosine-5)-methyltransferase 1